MSPEPAGAWREAASRVEGSRGSILAGLAAVLAGCSVSMGSEEGPSVGIGGVAVPGEEPGSAEAALRDRLREELQALYRAEERYFAQNETYTDELYALRGDGGAYRPGPEVSVRISSANDEGFSAIAARAHVECALRVGEAPPPRPYATAKGVTVCRPGGRTATATRTGHDEPATGPTRAIEIGGAGDRPRRKGPT